MSASPLIADIVYRSINVRYVPQAGRHFVPHSLRRDRDAGGGLIEIDPAARRVAAGETPKISLIQINAAPPKTGSHSK